MDILTAAQYVDLLRASGDAVTFPLTRPLVVDIESGAPPSPVHSDAFTALPAVVVGLGRANESWAESIDLFADTTDGAFGLLAAIDARPLAATALALLLRSQDHDNVARGLVQESITYSTLQHGPEFTRWLGVRGPGTLQRCAGACVDVERHADVLQIALSRPEKHNAFCVQMRDELLDALAIANADDSVTRVELRGAGPSFCSGGDLDEFGTKPDPATAHLVRVARSAGAAIHAIADRTEVYLNGACFGAGIELAAFAGRVIAAPDAVIALPELTLGLIPGAGGTVSITRRAGRHRTAYMALSGTRLDADTALDWGLIDEIA